MCDLFSNGTINLPGKLLSDRAEEACMSFEKKQ